MCAVKKKNKKSFIKFYVELESAWTNNAWKNTEIKSLIIFQAFANEVIIKPIKMNICLDLNLFSIFKFTHIHKKKILGLLEI